MLAGRTLERAALATGTPRVALFQASHCDPRLAVRGRVWLKERGGVMTLDFTPMD